jgi:DNA-binding protein H-NS
MQRDDLASMSTDELWTLQQTIAASLVAKLTVEKKALEDRLRQLGKQSHAEQVGEIPGRRPYPTVVPKYQNLENPSETWSGRGKQATLAFSTTQIWKKTQRFPNLG